MSAIIITFLLSVAISFFFILAPSSSIVPIADLAFEHRMYLPLAAVIVLATEAETDLESIAEYIAREQRDDRVKRCA